MEKVALEKLAIPDAPGVYRFLGVRGEVLYVGRATSLRDRVKSYFVKDLAEVRSPLIAKIIADAKTVSWEETDSVLEAIILEAKRIKEFTPPGNTDLKDNKSFAYLAVTDEPYPRFRIIRERELESKAPRETLRALFGPFKSATILAEALKIVRKIFPLFDTPFPITETPSPAQKKILSFNQSLGLYPQAFDQQSYGKTVKNIIFFFEGKKKFLISSLENEMHRLARLQKFEEADMVKRQLFALTHIQDVTLIREDLKTPTSADFRIEAYDIAHLKGDAPRGVMAVVVNGEPAKSEYRTFVIKDAGKGDDIASLKEVLRRRFVHSEWPYPHLIVIDGGATHMTQAKKFLASLHVRADVVSVVKDERHRPREVLGPKVISQSHETGILFANAEAHRFSISRHRKAFRKRF